MKKFLLFLMSLFPLLGIGATTLSPGDIIIVAINGDTDGTYGRGFSFMPLVNLEAGTEIYFTDYGWSDVAGAFINSTAVSDVFVKYTAPGGGVTAGTVIRNATNSTTNFAFYFAYGISTYNYVNIVGVAASDEVIAFQGSIASPTLLFAASYVSTAVVASSWATGVGATGGTNGVGSGLPGTGNGSVADLVDDVTALSFNQPSTGNDNCAYVGTIDGTGPTDKAGWQARIRNYSNWSFNDAIPIPTPMSGSYIVQVPNSDPTDIALSPSSINENVAGGSAVGTLTTTDVDMGNTFTYTLVAGIGADDNASFSISGASLQINSSPNYEAQSSYSVLVRSTDQGGLYFEKQFTITVSNVNEAPSITSSSTANVAENTTAVLTVTSADPDANATAAYSIIGGADGVLFSIVSGTGVLTFNSAPNYETPSDAGGNNVYNVQVQVSDGSLTGNQTISVTVIDVAELPTVTTQAVSSILATTATGNGNITVLGQPTPSQFGVIWSTSINPTVDLLTKTEQGAPSGTGAFTSSITGLSANTTYHVRAYATNNAGSSYGDDVTFTTLTAGTWTGATNTDWATASNWAGGSVPISATDVVIPSGKTPIISATTTANCNNLTVTGSLTIQSSASGTGSLIVSGTSSGTVTAERYMTGNKWHIVTPIAAFGSISTFIQASGNAIPLKNVSGTNRYAMMDYNETTNTWNPYYAATTPDILPAGKGYSVRRTSDGIVTFTGDLTSGTKLVWLGKGGTGWNCIGNPYTSAINMNDAANTSYNFLKTNAIDNTSTLDPSYACMYVWDDATLSYKILGNVSFGTRDLLQNVLQAGQGFFVKAASDGVLVQFTKNMQVHSTTTNLKSAEVAWPSITLGVTNDQTSASAVVAFNNAMTKGLDPTYDAGLLRGTSGLELYSRLVNDNGVDFAIQCLPETYNSFVIPIGLESKTGGEITFSAETVDLPADCKVILEDKATNTFISLADGASYKTTVSAGSTAVGRFYIHTGDNFTTETSGQAAIGNLKAYTVNRAIIIEGEVSDKAIATLYNVQGLRIRVQPLKKGSMNTFSCPDLMNGIYLLTIQQNGEKVTRKLIKK